MESEANGSVLREGGRLGCSSTGDSSVVRGVESRGEIKHSSGNGTCGRGCQTSGQTAGGVPQTKSHGLASDSEAGGLTHVHSDGRGIEVYASGGKRDRLDERWDLIPGLQAVAKAMHEGAVKYGEHNWRGLPASNVANHALRHLYLWLAGDRSEDHLGHAAANCLMLVELEGVGERDKRC